MFFYRHNHGFYRFGLSKARNLIDQNGSTIVLMVLAFQNLRACFYRHRSRPNGEVRC